MTNPPSDWEQELDQELKALPDHTAPPALIRGVLGKIHKRESLPWHRRPWLTWPVGLRTLSLATLSIVTVLVGVVVCQLAQSAPATALFGRMTSVGAMAGILWDTLGVLAGAAVLSVKQLGTGFLVAVLTFAACSYALCIGAGTLVVRFALARR